MKKKANTRRRPLTVPKLITDPQRLAEHRKRYAAMFEEWDRLGIKRPKLREAS